jgi:hypothetical protein
VTPGFLGQVDGFAAKELVEDGARAQVLHLTTGQPKILDCFSIEMTENLLLAVVWDISQMKRRVCHGWSVCCCEETV